MLSRQQQDAIRQRIVEAGIVQFLANGYEATSVDAIAEAAGVSRRSVFRYFETKEDIVLTWAMSTGPGLVRELDGLDCITDTVRAALDAVSRHVGRHEGEHPVSLAVGRLIERTPSLRARAHEKYLGWEDLLSDALTVRGAAPVAARMAAALAIGGLRIAAREWVAGEGRRPIGDILAEAYGPFCEL
ncbi:AcrR family transcriptional regulator [Methylobacterium brachiatum]|uniref:AcrR family transcriptional regulator n=1 Tax=Methylobacterium brachiatum TaxID=269660 RepID=A0AAJ1WVD6_9HYPH|nr:helix-turn-helix domain-containing protein [Methylobacterium brachiatum]MCB4802202.1 TetR/AcrR family transcriptional regulator [Methylobacterium brachiatum]MDQ0542545.1 AcrR family transcriptional regulator [Methylobacterium brachiatum]